MITDDYIVRMIRDLIRMTAHLLGLEAENPYAPQHSQVLGQGDGPALLERLKGLADQGEIDQAENQLFEGLDFSDPRQFYQALAFYEHLNSFSDARLELCGYSREEIFEGLQDCAARFGVDKSLTDIFQQ